MLRATPADLKNNFTARTVGLVLQITRIAIRFIRVLAGSIRTIRLSMIPGFFPELLAADITQGIEAGFTFRCQGITTPVHVCHGGIESFCAIQAKNSCFPQ
jgi:hypothetical protein